MEERTWKKHLAQRLIDVATVVVVGLVFWAVYTGFVVMRTVRDFYSGQCQIVQDQALEQAVNEELQRRAVNEGEVKE